MLRFKQVRMEHQVSQKELASILGIGISSLSQYENGKRQPDFQIVSKFADYFGVTVDYLLGREEQTSSSSDAKKAPTPENEGERKQADELETRFINAVQRLPLTQKVALLELVEAAGRASV